MASRLQSSRTVEAGGADSEARRPRGARLCYPSQCDIGYKKRKISKRARRILRHVMYVGIYFYIHTRKCVYALGGISSSEAPTVTVEFFSKLLSSPARKRLQRYKVNTHTMFCSYDAGSVSGTSLISHLWSEVDWKSILQRSSSSTPLDLHTATSGFLVRSAATSGHAPPIPPPLSEVKGRSPSGRAAGPLLLKTSLPFIS